MVNTQTLAACLCFPIAKGELWPRISFRSEYPLSIAKIDRWRGIALPRMFNFFASFGMPRIIEYYCHLSGPGGNIACTISGLECVSLYGWPKALSRIWWLHIFGAHALIGSRRSWNCELHLDDGSEI